MNVGAVPKGMNVWYSWDPASASEGDMVLSRFAEKDVLFINHKEVGHVPFDSLDEFHRTA